ncbi:unnamed protein product [Gulo gulo]|uniref:HMG box domain-containing protein n=1 Tax=Gulo gulo TaxID=48420 RepID=A0A9X9LYM5_GULGU|nr:unnamed protein product [Gulo gulo]
MGNGKPKKLRGKRSLYAFVMQTCQEEHKKKHPEASADKVHNKREMKICISPKGETKKKFRDPNAHSRPPLAFFLICSEYHSKIKGEHPSLSISDVAKKLGQMWNKTATDNKQLHGKKLLSRRKNRKRILLHTELKEKPDAAKNRVIKAKKSKQKKQEEEDKEDEENEEEKEDEEDDE